MLLRNSSARAATAAALLVIAGGSILPAQPAAAAVPGAAAASRWADGVWRMDGYGTVLTVAGDHLQTYQTTSVSCLKGDGAGRSGTAAGSVTFAAPDATVLTLRPRGTREAALHIGGSPGDRMLRRIPALPADCSRPGPTGPVASFDVFWQTFEENYPFFAAKGIDWHAVRERYRPRINAGSTDAQLFAVLSEMVRPLYDAHVSVDAGDTGFFAQGRPGTAVPSPELDARVRGYVEECDLGGRPLQYYAGNRIGYADLPNGQGYLRISGFGGYTDDPHDSYAANSAELQRALDEILTPERTARLSGLIIDLRINGGGSDSLGLQIASRLTDRSYLAYSKTVRNDPADSSGFTRPQPIVVQPARGARYTGPVAVLTSGSTVSAGETFTQALIDRPGGTARIGESTQGVFSDVLERSLPNGWQIGLPDEEFRTRSGGTFDGPGIPPQYPEPVFTPEEFSHHRDSAFDRAVSLLSATGQAAATSRPR
ncbi:S41 family peptidase [Saccharothrix sp. ST-888]|uniref:S41 family peptidase n=1 Tax=Saccharothrix sp. ST-888 TaxID=1427391 RepID=UPI000AF3D407|nr:S41 family peptidase [Saccharothrix sp. ST-888]